MKRTITMLITGLFSVFGLVAQAAVPMVVCGPVQNNGVINSLGEVVVSNTMSGGAISNTGTLDIPGGVTFISHGTKDGLLHNTGIVKLPTDPSKVVLRKSGLKSYDGLTSDGNIREYQCYISFPFEVSINEVYDYNEPKGMTGLWFYEYDAENRANTDATSGNWVYVDDNDPVKDKLKPMVSYYFVYIGNLTEIDFPAYTKTDLTGMYASKKEVEIVYNKNDNKAKTGWGWNAIGPAYTANYVYSAASLEMTSGFVHHYSVLNGEFKELDLDESDMEGTCLIVAPFSHTQVKWTDDEGSLPHKSKRSLKFSQGYGRIDYPSDYLRAASTSNKELIKLDLSGTRSFLDEDMVSVMFGDEYTTNLSVRDGEKLFTESERASRLWAEFKGSQLFSTKLPFVDHAEIPLGFRAGESGVYTLKLNNLTHTNYETIVLIDKKLGVETDLTSQVYSFNSEKGIDNSRFVLAVNRAPLAVNRPVAGIEIYASNSMLHVNGVAVNDRVQVFDVTGKLVHYQVANATEWQAALPQAGIYLVKIAGSNNLTSKVINK